MSDKRTLEKCRKLMQMFEKQKQRPSLAQCFTNPVKERPIAYNSVMSASKKQSLNSGKKHDSFCIPSCSNKKQSHTSYGKNLGKASNNRSSSSFQSAKKSVHSFSAAKSRSNSKELTGIKRMDDRGMSHHKNKSQYSSVYGNESRYDKIMKLKVKTQVKAREDHRGSYLNASKISFRSSTSSIDKATETKESRFDKIMKLKVHKPKVDSTLRNYQPHKEPKPQRTSYKENQNSNTDQWNPVLELKKCKERQKKELRQSEKEDRLWKIFERERELRIKQKEQKERASYERERSLEKRFDSLVQKELKRIQLQKELEERKEQGFSQYLFPSY